SLSRWRISSSASRLEFGRSEHSRPRPRRTARAVSRIAMTGPNVSFTWWSFADCGVAADELIETAAEMGYDGIELAEETDWPGIAAAGLAIASHRGHGTIEAGLNRPENHERIELEILANLELARRWHIPILICFSGSRLGLPDDEGIANTAAGL